MWQEAKTTHTGRCATAHAAEEVEAAEAEEDEHLKLEHDARQQIQKDQRAGEPASAAQVSAQEPLPDDRVKAIRQAMAGFTLTPPPWAAQVDEAIWMQKVGKERASSRKRTQNVVQQCVSRISSIWLWHLCRTPLGDL